MEQVFQVQCVYYSRFSVLEPLEIFNTGSKNHFTDKIPLQFSIRFQIAGKTLQFKARRPPECWDSKKLKERLAAVTWSSASPGAEWRSSVFHSDWVESPPRPSSPGRASSERTWGAPRPASAPWRALWTPLCCGAGQHHTRPPPRHHSLDPHHRPSILAGAQRGRGLAPRSLPPHGGCCAPLAEGWCVWRGARASWTSEVAGWLRSPRLRGWSSQTGGCLRCEAPGRWEWPARWDQWTAGWQLR